MSSAELTSHQLYLTWTEALKAGLLKFTFTVLTTIVIPSMTFWMKLYFPRGAESAGSPLAVGVPDRAISHVSIDIFTSSSVNVMGTLLSFAQDILNEMWLHHADVSLNHEGSSRSSISTASSSWRFVSSPSPLNVEMLILSLERFFVNLKRHTLIIKDDHYDEAGICLEFIDWILPSNDNRKLFCFFQIA